MGLFSFRRSKASSRVDDSAASLASSPGVISFHSPLSTHQAAPFEIIRIPNTKLLKEGKDSNHRIIFAGASVQEARDFSLELAEGFRTGRLGQGLADGRIIEADSHSEALGWVLNELAPNHWGNKEFFPAGEHQHELREKLNGRPWSHIPKISTVRHAFINGHLLEFGYIAPRGSGDKRRIETHIHRVHVTRIDESGFRGEHARGIRRYNFDRIAWAGVDTAVIGIPEPEPYMSFMLLNTQMFGMSLHMRFGLLGERGLMTKFPENAFSDFLKREA